MLVKAIVSAAFLALSVNAAAVATGKTFKFQVTDPKKGVFYLGDATGASTKDAAKAITCELAADVLKCGGKGFPAYAGDMVKLATTGNSAGWSIDATDNIKWSAGKNVHFSLGMGASGTDLWAEDCPHGHFPEHGTAKAIYV